MTLLPALGLALALAAAPTLPSGLSDAPALVLERGAVARHQIVAVGRDAVVDGEALAGVTALDGTARITGTVAGDVTVLGGDAELAATAVVRGHVQVLGGRLHAAPGARIEGRSVAYPTFSRAWLTLLEGPSLGLAATSPIVVGAKLGLMAAWLLLTIGLVAASGRGLGAASAEVRAAPGLCFATGLTAVVALFLSALLLAALLPSAFALPLLALAVLAALAAKLWGSVAVFRAAGRALVGRRRRRPMLDEACVGLALLGTLKFVPWLGVVVWSTVTLVGVGAALRTRFGREREEWLSAELLA
ncbi:MAG TPA: hypothetical protein VGC00_12635 [Thermoanaerobaculia bacterium]